MSTFTPEQIETAKLNGVALMTLHNRVRSGWSIEEAISTPPLNKNETAKRGAIAAMEQAKQLRSNSWFAKGANTLVRCPVPNCNHTGTVITKAHCRNIHNMERKKLGKRYGMPFQINIDAKKLFENTKEV